jgi:NodT family efflux transporter outer membrane factor (OMF) lipoprotein
MYRAFRPGPAAFAAVAAIVITSTGCTSFKDYVHNGYKVGPNYCRAPAPVAKGWIDAHDARVRCNSEDLTRWWHVFNDPALNRLILCAYQQNLTVKQAGFRILEARYKLAIAKGNLFPQTQTANGSFSREAITSLPPNTPPASAAFTNLWSTNFNLQWELDFWGQFRRAVQSQEAFLEQNVAGYDAALVTMFGDFAENYLIIRTNQEEIKNLRANVVIQKGVVEYTSRRLKAGFRETELDLDQARAIQESTEAQIPPLEAAIRQANDALCVLLGIPTVDLTCIIGAAPIPNVPPDVAVGIPAELLRRRPDVRQAERAAAVQAEQIGIAESALYPAFTINGTVGYESRELPYLFTPSAFNASVGPSFQWNVLNYGRITNNVKLQDATLQELITAYQQTVIQANSDVENGLATFLRSQEQTKLLAASVRDYQGALNIVLAQEKAGAVDYSRYATIATALVQQQDLLAQAQGQIVQGLVQVYRALGGGWEIRCPGQAVASDIMSNTSSGLKMLEELPAPLPKGPDTPGDPVATPPKAPAADGAEPPTLPDKMELKPVPPESVPASKPSGTTMLP